MMQATTALFLRSMRGETRRGRPALLRAALGLVLLLLIASAAGSAWRGEAGRALLNLCAWTTLVAVSVLGIPLFSGAIAEEKEDGTLSLLRLAGIRPLALILGGGIARLWHLLLALAVVPPFAVLAVTLGGVSLGQVGAAAAVLAAHLLLLAGCGILASVLSPTQARATTLCLGMLLAWMLGLPFLGLFAYLSSAPAWLRDLAQAAQWLAEQCPPAALARVLDTRWAGGLPWFPLALASGLGLLALGLAWLLLPRFAQDTPEAAAPARGGWAGGWRRWLVRLRRRPPSGTYRAVVWKDFHLQAGGWPMAALKMAAVLALIAPFTLLGYQSHPLRSFGQGLMVAATITGVLEFGLHLTRTCTLELRERTAEALFLLPGTATGLVWAKVRAALYASLPVWSLGLLGAGCASKDAADVVGSLASHLWGWVALATVLYFWAWCLWLSPVLRRLALPAAILAVVAVWFVAGLVNAALRADSDVGGAVMLAILATASVALAIDTPRRLVRRLRDS